VPFQDWLPYAVAFVGGIAFHQYSPVPVTPASHGCVRLVQGDAQWLYNFMSVGTPVTVISTS
jgi:lipoprotein-anchoring transpeptidase ErfK/SrfK